jgi:Pentapeptide repeats (8 copies)
LDVRLGGIYALERIAKDSAQDRGTLAEVLAAFIRGHAPWPPRPDQPGKDTPIKEIPYLRYRAADVQAALTVLGRQPSMTSAQPPNLSDTDLRRADLSNAELQGANLRTAQLQRVDLFDAQLHGARSNAKTVWPDGFDWKAAGVELLED